MNFFSQINRYNLILILLLSSACIKKVDSEKSSVSKTKKEVEDIIWLSDCYVTTIKEKILYSSKKRLLMTKNSLVIDQMFYKNSNCKTRLKTETHEWSYDVINQKNKNHKQLQLTTKQNSITFNNQTLVNIYNSNNPNDTTTLKTPLKIENQDECRNYYTTIKTDSQNTYLQMSLLKANKKDAFLSNLNEYDSYFNNEPYE